MAKNQVKSAPVKQDDSLNSALNFFIPGCLAELFLLVVQRYYVKGTLDQVVAWDGYLKGFAVAGLLVLILGGVLTYLWRSTPKYRPWAIMAAVLGGFVGISGFLITKSISVLSLLIVLVPVVMLLGILWSLYDRECAMSLTILGVSLMMLWLCRRAAASMYVGTAVKAAIAVAVILCIVIAVLVKQGKLSKVLPANADPLPIYVACALGGVLMAVGLFSTAVAYYAMWILAIVVFGLAVYYTVKQL